MGVRIDKWTVQIGNKSSYLKTAIRVFLLNFKKKKYDLIHAFYSLNGLLARLQFISPVIVTFMGSDILSHDNIHQKGGRDVLIGKIIARLVNEIIVRTTEMAEIIHGPKDHVHIIASGINTDIFKPTPLETARRELSLPVDEKCVLFPYNPARMEKGFTLVEQAVDILNKKGPVRLLAIYNQPRQVLAKYMNACDAMVLASAYEGSPMAVREALACNLPIVSVRVGDVTDIIANIDGCYISERNPHNIAEKLGLVFERGNRIIAQEKINSMNITWSANEVMKIYNRML